MTRIRITLVTLAFAALVPVTQTAAGQDKGADRIRRASRRSYQMAELRKLEPGILVSLNHEVEGVVVCAIREVVCLQLAQPGCHSARVRGVIDDLALHGSTPSIRFRAWIAGVTCDHPELFESVPWDSVRTDDELFSALSVRLRNMALTESS